MSLVDGLKIFEDLSIVEKSNLSLFCQVKEIKKGETLFHEGDEANAMYILADGKIEISKLTEGRRVKLGIVDAEDILGEMALFGGKSHRMATAIAQENSFLVVVLSFSIMELTYSHPQLLEKIKRIIEERANRNIITEGKNI
ncbi:MAG: cyclic nucleotide-binding domain-containing protein [Candidatus Gracilibacteria bacterium]|nr:cyclic nucleotide-binding domain-containing protein [Candidatus Gracilibacteria bacterium]